MQFRYLSLLAPAFASIATAAPVQQTANGALYLLCDDPSGASVVAMSVRDGSIVGEPVMTSTGGTGAISTNSSGDSVSADPLGSQSPVVVYGNMLFTVNPGSATVSMFQINPSSPQDLTLIDTASTGGSFPMSLDYSPALEQVCVLNGGSDASVTCMHADPWNGFRMAGAPRMLSKDYINETTPPNGPPGAASQLAFNPQGTAVFVTIRGVPNSHNGYILVYPVGQGGRVKDTPVANQMGNIVLPFGFTFTHVDKFFLSDPSFGVALMHVNPDWTLTEKARTPISGQSAICWTAVDQQLKRLYALDAGSSELWTLDNHLVQEPSTALTTGQSGFFDSVIADNMLYSLSGSPGINTIDLKSGSQSYTDLSSVGPRAYLAGMAYFGY